MNDISDIFHRASSNHLRDPGKRGEATSPDEWPESWKIIYVKSYPRLPSITLNGEIRKLRGTLVDSLESRATGREFSGGGISLPELATLLFYSAGIKAGTKRFYPSAGARYPLEIYTVVRKGSEGLLPGLYHYNVKENRLEVLGGKESLAEAEGCFLGEPPLRAAAIVCLTGVFDRTIVKYGARGYRFALIEAGHIGQNLALNATALGLKCCPYGGFIEDRLERFLDIDGSVESPLYTILFGQ